MLNEEILLYDVISEDTGRNSEYNMKHNHSSGP